VPPLKEILGLRRCGERNTLRAAAPHVAPGVRMQMTFARVNRLLWDFSRVWKHRKLDGPTTRCSPDSESVWRLSAPRENRVRASSVSSKRDESTDAFLFPSNRSIRSRRALAQAEIMD